jgi:hypothetical protein
MVVTCSRTTFAQSTISGQVKDASGAAMQGVRVDAASPTLIEGSRSVVTTSDGRYAIVDVRPGLYTITFTSPGFSSVQRQVEVRANLTTPVDAEMAIGAIEEMVNVAPPASTVDVQNATHPVTFSRSILDSVPTARNVQSVASYVPGVHMNIPDVGGSQQIQQTYLATHGNPHQHDVVMLDGMQINGTQNDGQIVMYLDNEMIQEATYSTIANPADAQAGGVFTNIVPKDGGNSYRGDFFGAFSGPRFVGNNLDSTLLARGISTQSKVTEIQDFDGSFGGALLKDRLWFLASGRNQVTDVQSPLCKNDDGTPCVEHDHIYTGHLRLTYQLNSKNKFSAMGMRLFKTNHDEVVYNLANSTGVPANVDASSQRLYSVQYITQERWTGTPTSNLLLQAGFSLSKTDYSVQYQDGLTRVPFSPAWYSDVMLQDTVLNLRYNVATQQNFFDLGRYLVQAGGAYVVGSHQIRFGVQDSWGPAYQRSFMNGDLYAVETNGVPTSVTVFNTPTSNRPYLNADLGLYVQDTWTKRRVTITPGVRWEYLSNEIEAESADAGRFVPARSFGAVTCDTYPGISCLSDWAPRLSVVYDLFGDHKTALKASAGKYVTPLVQGNLNAYNPMQVKSQSRAWINTGGCTGPTCFPTDDQIGPAPSGAFGTLTPRSVDPNQKREYNLQYSIGLQQRIRGGLTLNSTWMRRNDYQATTISNQAVPSSAWTPVTIANPLDGTPITVYNLKPSYVGLTPQLYQANAPRSLRANSYNGFETSVQGRLARGATVSGGWTIDRERSRHCDETVGGNSLSDPNSLRYCDWFGNLYQDLGAVGSIPYRSEFKLQGALPLWYNFDFSYSLYSDPVYNTNFALNNQASTFPAAVNSEPVFAGSQQGFKEVYWTLTSGTKYPTNCKCATPGAVVDPGLAQGSETIMLIAPGSRLTPQLTQLDIALRWSVGVRGTHRVKVEGQVFNVLNSNTVTAEAQTLGTSVTPFLTGGLGGVPSAILNPRMLRIALQFNF